MKSNVAIVDTGSKPDYNRILEAVKEAVGLIGGLEDIIKPGDLVLVNPSWVAPPVENDAGCITIPEVPRAVADVVREMGALPVIAESSAIGVDSEKIIEASGYAALRDMGYEVVNLKKTGHVKIPVKDGVVFDSIPCWELVQKADVVISVPKLKTHDQTEMTCAIKKLKGLLTDKGKKSFHQQGLFDGCIDLLDTIKPKLAVVDAITCMEGLGPVFGKPVEMNLVLAGKDLVAVDSTCARLIGFQPEETRLTVKAAERGIGVMDPDRIEILGEKLEDHSRRFMRAMEDDPVKVEGFQLIHGPVTCTGCRNGVMSSLIDMRNSDQMMYLPGVTILTGNAPIPEGADEKDVVTVGICMDKANRTERYVKGCPPNNADIVKAILGGRAESDWMYGDGEKK